VPAGLEGLARMQRAQEATGGMIQFDDEVEDPEGVGLSLVRDDLNTVGLRSLQSSTPLRSKNYDLLKKAATYIAVQRLMAAWDRDSSMAGVLQWFSLQWHDKYKEPFQQDSGRHLADRFLTNLISSPSVAVRVVASDTLFMVSPPQLAMAIVDERARVVESFISWLETPAVEDGHRALERNLLARSLAAPADDALPPRAGEPSTPVASSEGSMGGEDLERIWKPPKEERPDDSPQT